MATHDFGLERRLDLPVGNLLPIDPPEELVPLDVLLALIPASQTLGGILDQKLKRATNSGLPRRANFSRYSQIP